MDMRKLWVILLIAVAFSLYADQKPAKNKSKRFESVAVRATEVTGSYRGPEESYGIILELTPQGTLRGNYVEMGRVAVLHAIDLKGADFTARASFADGSSRTIRGSFARRILNGTTAFGLRVHEVPVESLGTVDTFFERF
jgi:hypothetical protein